jgi:hypothetical protein
MTITLYWWYSLILIFLIGIIGFVLDPDTGGYFPKLMGTLWVIICVAIIVGITLGHFI